MPPPAPEPTTQTSWTLRCWSTFIEFPVRGLPVKVRITSDPHQSDGAAREPRVRVLRVRSGPGPGCACHELLGIPGPDCRSPGAPPLGRRVHHAHGRLHAGGIALD